MLKPAQARMARTALGWSLAEIQGRTGINKNTIVRFEAGKGVLLSTVSRLEDAFAKEGISFIYEDDTRGPGVVLSKDLSRRLEHPPNSPSKATPTTPAKK
jgi:transcriptional regulator with XRE-family HTH domain